MRDRRESWLLLVLCVGCALLVQCSVGSPAAPTPGTATPAAKPEPTTSPLPAPTTSLLFASPISPIPAPSPTPAAREEEYKIQSWALFSRTRVDSIQGVFAKLTSGGEGVAGAEMYVVARYGGKERRYPEQGAETTSEKGIASVSFPVADARPEEAVEVDVYVTYHETTYHSVVSFAANC